MWSRSHPTPSRTNVKVSLLDHSSASTGRRLSTRGNKVEGLLALLLPFSSKRGLQVAARRIAAREEPEREQGAGGSFIQAAGAMAMALQSPLQLDSLSNGFMGMGLSTPRPATQASPKFVPTTIRMEIKRWERKEVKENSLPVVKKLHVKIGDTVKVIAGHDKGKVSTITKLYTHNSKVLLKDVNLKTKHVKGKAEGETGQIVQVEAPIHSSNVMLYSKTAKVASRVGHKTLEDGRKVRFLLKTGEVIDSAEDWKKVHKKKEDKTQ